MTKSMKRIYLLIACEYISKRVASQRAHMNGVSVLSELGLGTTTTKKMQVETKKAVHSTDMPLLRGCP